MTNTLRDTIALLAEEFAQGILAAIRSASLEEILAESRDAADAVVRQAPKNARLERRSPTDIEALIDAIVALLASRPEGLRAEQIRQELGLEAKELPRPIAEALAARKITKQGEKRATTYFAGAPAVKKTRKMSKKRGLAKTSGGSTVGPTRTSSAAN